MADVPPREPELEKLLAQLLRVVSPAWVADTPADDAKGTGAGEPLPALSGSEARALIELASARGIAQGQLAAMLGLEKSTVSRLAAGLERKGWVRRGRDGENQRFVRLYLTPQGGEVAARVWQALLSRQARILSGLSNDERAGLSAGLRGLVRGLAAEGLLSDAVKAARPAANGSAGGHDAAAAHGAAHGNGSAGGDGAAARYDPNAGQGAAAGNGAAAEDDELNGDSARAD